MCCLGGMFQTGFPRTGDLHSEGRVSFAFLTAGEWLECFHVLTFGRCLNWEGGWIMRGDATLCVGRL